MHSHYSAIADAISIRSTLLVAGRVLEFFFSQDALHRLEPCIVTAPMHSDSDS